MYEKQREVMEDVFHVTSRLQRETTFLDAIIASKQEGMDIDLKSAVNYKIHVIDELVTELNALIKNVKEAVE